MGLQCPDASILLRGLDNITRKPLQDHGEVQFRMNMMRYTLEVDAKPTYKAVVDLHHAMLSEFEQVAFRGRPKQVHNAAPAVRSMTTTSGGTSTTPMTSDQGQGDASPGKGKGTPCKFFLDGPRLQARRAMQIQSRSRSKAEAGTVLDLWKQATCFQTMPYT